MCDRYNAPGDEDHPDLEDEFLCEYVDETMDPVVREVFEEYLRANPDLKAHVDCLRNTRLLLCTYGCRCHAPHDLHDRLRREISCDLVNGRMPFHVAATDRLKGAATLSTAMALVLFLGVIGGFSVVDAEHQTGAALAGAAVIRAESRPALSGMRSAIQIDHARFTPRYSTTAAATAFLRSYPVSTRISSLAGKDSSLAERYATLRATP